MQTRLDHRMIEHGVLFPSRHKSETGQVRKHRSGAVLTIEPEQRVLR